MLFTQVLVVDKYGLVPEEVALTLVPLLATSLVTSVWVGPRLLLKYGPRGIVKYTMIPAGE